MGFDNFMLYLDETITGVLSDWDIYSTLIITALIGFFAFKVITSRDPDSHPMLLARQSQASSVRQEGQSAIFRNHAAPHGMPLNSGLHVKDPGDSKWTPGRNGDLRDIWRRAVTGAVDREGKETGEIGNIMTIYGSDKLVTHKLADVTRQINLIGQHIKQNGGNNIAIYLPNSIEYLAALFACAFYDLNAILLPYDESPESLLELIKRAKADTVIAAVGSFPFDVVAKSYPALQQMIWVVDDGSKHMDWNEVPKGTGGAVNVSTWQEILQDQEAHAGSELPAVGKTGKEPNKVVAFWPNGELVEFTQSVLVAGVSGQLASIPTVQRITSKDLFLSAEPLSLIYPLILTLSALYSNASIALTSVSIKDPDLVLATKGTSPTIVVASSTTLAKLHAETKDNLTSSLYQVVHWFQTQSLVQHGVMPIATVFSRMYDHLLPIIGTTPGKLRLIYVSEPIGVPSTPLSAEMLSDLRIYTGSRIIYALTASKVAGAVSQTGIYDYRVDDGSEKYSHFGAPPPSVEIFLKDTKEYQTSDTSSVGEIIVGGPAVAGGEAHLGIAGKIKPDHTLALLS
ncbi:bba7797b-bae2-47ab-a55b-87d3c5f44b27 [Sclerotinia trifoliorum]|uniref:Bba7797b-bae2-47ab-a55b-87d3c5f44b27 n=1 Tax=Sclerotinia trifoliorum TaxID=28548 RepID=A0A8H2W5I8_9HELO|nr:bba7797b-bae2-47ab-a55b-87d3c5f44b27 [Sclerotinia trifoliorum]